MSKPMYIDSSDCKQAFSSFTPFVIDSRRAGPTFTLGYGLCRFLALSFCTIFFFLPSLAFSASPDLEAKILKLGVRADAPPFSFEQALKRANTNQIIYSGFSVALCDRIADRAISSRLYNAREYVQVTTKDRFDKLEKGDIQLLCGASTITLERMRHVDFTLITFLSGASVMYRKPGSVADKNRDSRARDFQIGVLVDTTTDEDALTVIQKFRNSPQIRELINSGKPIVYRVNNHDVGLERLTSPSSDDQRLDAYLADREILLALRNKLTSVDSQAAENLVVSRDYYTFEPYAIGIEPSNYELRYLANSVLSEMFDWENPRYKGVHIFSLLREYFPGKKFNRSLTDIYRLQRLPAGHRQSE